ncbi:MAG TPA: type IV pilus biogenesis/stability protein PilW [Burkholderiales bacterium]|jgi:type IV pilus assembly protein PilF
MLRKPFFDRPCAAVGLASAMAFCLALGGCAGNSSSGSNINPGGPRNSDRLVSMEGRSFGDPLESAKAHTELAFGYFQRGAMAVALDEISVALKSKSDYYQAYNVLGLVYMDLGENSKSEDAFRHALSIAPNDSDTLNNYGWFLCQTQRERQAIPQFMAALKNPLYSSPSKPYLNAGICSEKINDVVAAENYYRKAFSLDPGNPGVMLHLGDLYYKRNELDKARFYVDRLNKSFEPSAGSLWLALRIERKAGDRASESSYAAQLRRRYPDSPENQRLKQGQFE